MYTWYTIGDRMGKHGKYVPHCHWKNAIAVLMAGVTAGAWIPFVTDPYDAVPAEDEDEEFSVPAPIHETHNPPSWPETVVPRQKPVNLVKEPKNPATNPSHARPTPKVPVKLPPATHHPSPARTNVEKMVAYLKAQLGKPYVYGGNGPYVFDCSGLTKAAFAVAGVYLPRTSELQSLRGVRVSLSQLHVGDLLFWGGYGTAYHVAVYIGGGRYIAAQNPTVGVVERTLSYSPPDFARRIL